MNLTLEIFKLITRGLGKLLDARATSPQDLRAIAGFGSNTVLKPTGITLQAEYANGIPIEWFTPQKISSPALIIYLHGGGWTLGWYNSHRWLVGQICLAAECRAIAIDYRLAPEHPFPAALNDCVSVYQWLIQNGHQPQHLVIAGDSAGGNLTLSTLLALRAANEPLPACGVCISPATDLLNTGETFNATNDPLITQKFLQTMGKNYYGTHDPRDPLISPHYADLQGLPPLLIQVGSEELLLSDSLRLAEKTQAAGVHSQLSVGQGLWHVWHLYAPYLPQATAAIAELAEFVRRYTRPA